MSKKLVPILRSSRGQHIIKISSKSFDVNWIPWDAINIVSEDGAVNFKDLPSDNVMIEVFFKNGKIMIEHLKLSFNNEGNLIAEIITK